MPESAALTENDLQILLDRIAIERVAGPSVELGRLILKLSHVVKWVRSDTDTDPFTRSLQLADESLEIFRAVDSKADICDALLGRTGMNPREVNLRLLTEAESLARELGDLTRIGRVLERKAANTWDFTIGIAWLLEAKSIFESEGYKEGIAQTLFSLAIRSEDGRESARYALEAADLNLELGNPRQAGKCFTLVLMYSKKFASPEQLEATTLRALSIAQTCEDYGTEESCYRYLAGISWKRGHRKESAKFKRWAAELESRDGLTKHERSAERRAFARAIAPMARMSGHTEFADMAEKEAEDKK